MVKLNPQMTHSSKVNQIIIFPDETGSTVVRQNENPATLVVGSSKGKLFNI